MDRIVKLHKEKKKFVRNSGMSGPQLTLIERSVDDILLLNPSSSSRTIEDDYIAPQGSTSTSRLSAVEKRLSGERIRNASLNSVGTSRVRDPRVDSSFADTMGRMAGTFGMAVENQEAARRNFLTDMRDQDDRKQEEQRRKDRQEEERLDRQTRQEQLNTTMQTVQLKLLSDLVSKPTAGLNARAADEVLAQPHVPGVQPDVAVGQPGDVAVGQPDAPVVVSGVVQKTISVYYSTEEDSDQLPSVIVMKDFPELKFQIAELCGIKNMNTKDIKIILDHTEIILNICKIVNGAEYTVSKRVKPANNLVKIYMDKN